ASFMQRVTPSGASSMFTPRAAKTSAAPEREERARLPCFATETPAPATINAAHVEILNEPDASPPVPTTSMASAGARTRNIFWRIAVTAPVISSTVSPRTRSAIKRPPIWEGVASPDIIVLKPRAASSRVSVAPEAAFASKLLNSSLTSLSQHSAACRVYEPNCGLGMHSMLRQDRESCAGSNAHAPKQCSRDEIALRAPASSDAQHP